jgi:hypothetical protein
MFMARRRMAVRMVLSALVVLGLLFAPLQLVQAAPAVDTVMTDMDMAGMGTPCEDRPDTCGCETARPDCAVSFSCMAKCGGMAASHFESRSIAKFAGEAIVPWQPTSLGSLLIPPPRRPPRV